MQNTSNIKISLHLSEQLSVKILFVDDNNGLQEKWIEPLRGEGWGVLRTKSVQDAEKIFEFHGDSLNVLIVSEKFAEWASQWNFSYIVLLTSWKDVQVMKHQNSSSHPATHYLDFDSNFELLKQAVVEAKGKVRSETLKPTGSDASSVAIVAAAKSQSSGGEIEIGFSHSAPVSSAEPSDSSAQEGVLIQLDQYAGQKAELQTKPTAEPSTEAQKDHEATVILNLSEGTQQEVSPDVINFLNEDSHEIEAEEQILESSPVELELAEEDATQMVAVEDQHADELSDDVELMIEDEPEESILEQPMQFPVSSADKDIETMKNYLALREQDVAVLTGQLRSSQERIQQLEGLLKVEKARSAELSNSVQKQDQEIKSFERDKQVEFEVMYQQIEDLNLQLRERTDKTRAIETKLKIMTDEVEKVKERVRLDLRRIRVREKELENQLEILKKDSTALLVARDEKIVELKRKIDLLEFNMELVQEQYGKERNLTDALRQKLKEAAGAVKRAGGLLDQEN